MLSQLKKTIVFFVVVILSGCGGHGFEGEYKAKVESVFGSGFDSFFNDESSSESNLIIGKDFIKVDGERIDFDSISVRDNKLVLETEDSEDFMTIVNEKTLILDQGVVSITYIKI